MAPRPPVVPSRCWIGKCAGCGRMLVSATWNIRSKQDSVWASLGYRNYRPVFCTKRCRAENEASVYSHVTAAVAAGTSKRPWAREAGHTGEPAA